MTADEADAALSDAARLRLDPGEVCTLARLRAGLTQAQVAADLGVAKMTVSLWERRACPGRDYLIEYWRARGYAALLPAARPHAGSAQLRGAYERGRVAGLAGEPSSSCPYAITPGRGGFRRVWRFNWLAGWRAGEAERRKSLG
jgi:DNA-binding XRE family transcriptional regulator/ribosome modulation factor